MWDGVGGDKPQKHLPSKQCAKSVMSFDPRTGSASHAALSQFYRHGS